MPDEKHCLTCRCDEFRQPAQGEHGICRECGWQCLDRRHHDTQQIHCGHTYSKMNVFCVDGNHDTCQTNFKGIVIEPDVECVCTCHALPPGALEATIAGAIDLAVRLAADAG